MGNCVYHIAHRSFGNILRTTGTNAEVGVLTQALYEARELAMSRMQAEGERLNASRGHQARHLQPHLEAAR